MANSEAKNAYNRRWAEANPDRVKASSAKWRANNQEKKHAESAAYRRANRVKIREKAAKKRDENRESHLQYHRDYYRANKEKFLEASRQWARENPEKTADIHRESYLRRHFGIGIEEYERMLVAQAGVCAICRRAERGKRLAVDHCHTTGAVRGLLCQKCNIAIGLLDDEPLRARATAEYLERAS